MTTDTQQSDSTTDLNEIDLNAIDDLAELEKILMKVNIAHTLASIEKMRQDNDRANQDSEVARKKQEAETAKILKDNRYYFLALIITFMGGAGFVALLGFFTAVKATQ